MVKKQSIQKVKYWVLSLKLIEKYGYGSKKYWQEWRKSPASEFKNYKTFNPEHKRVAIDELKRRGLLKKKITTKKSSLQNQLNNMLNKW